MVALTSEGLRKAAQKLKAKSAYLYITSFQPSAIGVGHRRRPSASAIGVGHRRRPSASAIGHQGDGRNSLLLNFSYTVSGPHCGALGLCAYLRILW